MIDGIVSNITGWLITLTNNPGGIIGTPGGPAAPPPPAGTTTGGDVINAVSDTVQNGGGLFDGGIGIMLIYAGVLIVAMYFLMFRGPRRREKKAKEMQASLRTGDNVVVTGGMFGRIADVGDDCFVVEFGTNRGIRIPVLKSDVLGVREPKLTPPPKDVNEKDS